MALSFICISQFKSSLHFLIYLPVTQNGCLIPRAFRETLIFRTPNSLEKVWLANELVGIEMGILLSYGWLALGWIPVGSHRATGSPGNFPDVSFIPGHHSLSLKPEPWSGLCKPDPFLTCRIRLIMVPPHGVIMRLKEVIHANWKEQHIAYSSC